jgi:preprotein translocase subunit SecE
MMSVIIFTLVAAYFLVAVDQWEHKHKQAQHK